VELPTLRQLEYVVAIADTLSFARAAERCAVSQPGLSSQIRQVEENLGLKLFERDPRGVQLTGAGREIARLGRSVLANAQRILETARSFQAPLTGTIRLGVIPTIAPYLLPTLLPRVRARFQSLKLFLFEGTTADITHRMREGNLDLLLLDLDAPLGPCQTLHVLEDSFSVLVPSHHELALRSSVREEDLQGEQVLILEDGHCLRDRVLQVCSRGGAHELGDFRAASLNTLLRMVEQGLGITLIPEMAIGRELQGAEGVTVVPFEEPAPSRRVGLAWRENSPRAEEFSLLGDLLAE
jgi:LysR family hydrogen peroxide-inducible transcriptional activator